MNKEERIAAINARYDEAVAEINKRREYRMNNYYNCVDDYSWGGICDKADNELQDRLRTERDIEIEQVKNDGYYLRHSEFYRLVDDNGNEALGTSYGRYGHYFAIGGKFVSVPKRVATLEKKGYRLERVTRQYRCVFKKFSNKGNVVNKEMSIVSETIEKVETMPEHIGSLSFLDWHYENDFKQDASV